MSISVYSVVMAIAWFSLAALIGSFALRKTTKSGLLFVALIFILALFRGFIPVEFTNSIIIRSEHWYPFLQDLIQTPLFQSITIGIIILFVWLLGSVIRLVFVCRKLFLLHKFRKNIQLVPSDNKLVILATDVAKELNYTNDIDLAISHNATTAYQAGFNRPFILLPANIDSFTNDEIRSMLRHELCHFLGRDLWIKIALQYVTCILWWNPIMSMLNASIEQMLELRCDQRAYKDLSKEARLAYLETLLHLAKNNSTSTPHFVLGYIGSNEDERIVQRFRLIEEINNSTMFNAKSLLCLSICLLLFLVSYFVIIQPWTALSLTEKSNSAAFNSETSYIIHTADDKFELFVNDMYVGILLEETLEMEPFCNYIIYEGGSPNGKESNLGD